MAGPGPGPSSDLAIVAHELRTPLATLRLLSETLIDRYGSSPNVRRLGDQIRCISGNLSDTLESMLDPARLRRGSAAWQDLDLKAVAEQAIATARPLLVSSPVRIVGPVGYALPMRGEPDSLRRVVVNLLANAVRHVRLGGIMVSLEHARRRRAWNVVTVSDTGSGMDEDVLTRVCRPEEHEMAAGGLGLGLRICRLIAAAHGGFLEIASTPGEGTMVRVFLRADLPRMRSGGSARAIRSRGPVGGVL